MGYPPMFPRIGECLYSIKVRGDAKIVCHNENDEDVGQYIDVKRFNGLSDESNLVDYIDVELSFLKGGNTIFNTIKDKLYTETTYYSERKLNESQLERLKQYTQGQWSDGWGEGFEQSPVTQINGSDVYISPWHRAQKITISQIDLT